LKELVNSNNSPSIFEAGQIEIIIDEEDIDKYFKQIKLTNTNEDGNKKENPQSKLDSEKVFAISSLIENNKYTVICIIINLK
jgi:hypothetical protein